MEGQNLRLIEIFDGGVAEVLWDFVEQDICNFEIVGLAIQRL